jgi:hypothetical protein
MKIIAVRKTRKPGATNSHHVLSVGNPASVQARRGHDRIRRMGGPPTWTCVFYVFVLVIAVLPILFVWSYWHEAKTRGWDWTSDASRNMYVDAAKTLITASGIAVALLASSTVASARVTSNLVAFSAKVAVVCLISCVCLSLIVILALMRGFERAQSRHIESGGHAGQGQLNSAELLSILTPAGGALSCFLVGFVFLGRIAFHF